MVERNVTTFIQSYLENADLITILSLFYPVAKVVPSQTTLKSEEKCPSLDI